MGDRPIHSEGSTLDGDDTGRTMVPRSGDVVARRQDPLTAAPIGAVQIPFELAVFRQVDADAVDVMVCGMWSGDTPVLECHEVGETLMLRVLGVDDDRREPQPYRIVLRVDLADTTVVEVRGTRHSERISSCDLAELSIVCGADPSMAGLAGPFLHCRGSALVRVEPSRGVGPGPVRRSSITLVA